MSQRYLRLRSLFSILGVETPTLTAPFHSYLLTTYVLAVKCIDRLFRISLFLELDESKAAFEVYGAGSHSFEFVLEFTRPYIS